MNKININYINDSKTTEIAGEKVKLIKFRKFNELDFIKHGFSTRLGGVSCGIYESMNLNFGRGDDDENVRENFRLIASELGTSPEKMVNAMQTHTTNVLKVGSEKNGMGVIRERDFKDIDGLITDEPGVCLVTSYADCIPLFFADPVKRCIGLSHSGWRGTVGKIGIKTVQQMKKEYGSEPSDIIAFIGPGICSKCYEVSEDVADEFKASYSEKQAEAILEPKENGKYQLDLLQANLFNLIEAGLLLENIGVTDICTCCNPELLFSHRASKGQRGGLCGFLAIKDGL